MDDAGEIDGEAIIAMLEDDVKDALVPAIRKCEGTRKYYLINLYIMFWKISVKYENNRYRNLSHLKVLHCI